MSKIHVWLCFVVSFFWGSVLIADEYQYVGTQRFDVVFKETIIPLRIYYPTETQSEVTKFGPWKIDLARKATIADGEFPIVIISHGLGGNSWNHHLLASALVKSGFVVVAPHHDEDWLRIGTREHWFLRPLEVSASLDFILEHELLSSKIDPSRIGAYGFSLGGYTMTALAGGAFDLSRLDTHCERPENDPEFCMGTEDLPLWVRAKRLAYAPPNVDKAIDVVDRRIKALALSAPIGVVFTDLYLSHFTIRTFWFEIMRKLSVTWCVNDFHSFGIVFRKNARIASANCFCVG